MFKFRDGAPLHDPCAVAAVVAPELFEVSPYQLAVQRSRWLGEIHGQEALELSAELL